MAKADLTVIGQTAFLPRRIAASATRFEVGEPIIQAGVTWTTGTASANVFTLAAIDIIVLGTDIFGGLVHKRAKPADTGTLVAQEITTANPYPNLSLIRGVAEVKGSVDTDTELLGIMQDFVFIDYNATGAVDGGELYTIKEADSGDDNAGFQLQTGNIVKGTLDVTTDLHCYRFDRS